MKLPEKFLTRMQEMLGEEYPVFLQSYEEPRSYGLRINTAKISTEEWERISPFPIRRIPWIPNGYFYEKEVQPGKHPYYYAGLYYLQDPSAMTPASQLPVEPGDAVLDLCAAPGGKATELGARLRGEGVLVANDISNSRAKALLKNIELFGIANPFVVNEYPDKLVQYFEEYFDKILIDAPCSGEGMFRKEPAVIKSWEANGTSFYAKLQREILMPAVRMLKPGGKLLYSTCTFSPEEDEATIQYVLNQFPELSLIPLSVQDGFGKGHPEWIEGGSRELEMCARIWPHRMEGEGHFLALLQKDGEGFARRLNGGSLRTTNNPDRIYMEEFLKDIRWDFAADRIEWQGGLAFYMPEGFSGLKGMRFLRNGLLLGELKKKRFEPSQALAMALREQDYVATISIPISDERVERYLKGETIEVGDLKVDQTRSWQLICVDHYPLGWAKLTKDSLKNKYQAGWRKL